MAQFVGRLVTECVRDDKDGLFELVIPFEFISDITCIPLVAPVGFRTDFMTVKRIPIVFELLGNRGRKSGTIHDLMYTSHCVDRATADHILHEMLLLDGMSFMEADACYLAVRSFGESHW